MHALVDVGWPFEPMSGIDFELGAPQICGIRITQGDVRWVWLLRDATGRLVRRIRSDGSRLDYAYDSDGRVQRIEAWGDGAVMSWANVAERAADGRLLAMVRDVPEGDRFPIAIHAQGRLLGDAFGEYRRDAEGRLIGGARFNVDWAADGQSAVVRGAVSTEWWFDADGVPIRSVCGSRVVEWIRDPAEMPAR